MAANRTAERKGILELLDHRSPLRTPNFQRSFAWTEENVEEYWGDLKRELDRNSGPNEYFLGLVVLDEAGHIQDGQQRLVTTLLLAGELYVAAQAATQNAKQHNVATNVAGLLSPALKTGKSVPLTINPIDQPTLVGRLGVRPDATESVKRLAKARKRLEQLVAADLSSLGPDAALSRIEQWGEFLQLNAYVVVLRVPTQAAHNIFETLNTRGVRLSNGDLVKSHLIAASDDPAAAITKWSEITASLTDKKGNFESDLEAFLLHYFGSMYGKVVKRDLFLRLRPRIADLNPMEVLESLHENSTIYRALVAPSEAEEFWAVRGHGTLEAARLIDGLGLKQLRYILLAILRDLGKGMKPAKQHSLQGQAVRKLAAWSVRGLVHGQLGGGEAETTYVDGALAIREGRINGVSELKQHFVDHQMLSQNDELFKEEFRAFQFAVRTSHNRAGAAPLDRRA